MGIARAHSQQAHSDIVHGTNDIPRFAQASQNVAAATILRAILSWPT
jgi:hypothetical protein